MARARPADPALCRRWLYCGAPYYLPVLSLIGSGHTLPAARPPLAAVVAGVAVEPLNATARLLTVNVTAAPGHVVVVVSPAEGARLAWSSLLERPAPAGRWNGRAVYFFALHQADEARPWRLRFVLAHAPARPPPQWAQVAVAGHAMAGAAKLHEDHERLLARLPAWVAATGWGVDLHLFSV